MIKLIVNYKVQVWTGDNYRHDKKSIILTFSSKHDVTNENIEGRIEQNENGVCTILEIQKI